MFRALGTWATDRRATAHVKHGSLRSVAIAQQHQNFACHLGADCNRVGADAFCAKDAASEGDLMLDPPGLQPERAVVYRQLATKLREVAMDDMDDQLRGDFLELARQYDARAANIWPLDRHGLRG